MGFGISPRVRTSGCLAVPATGLEAATNRRRVASARHRHALFLLAVICHAGAIGIDFLMTPGIFPVLRGCGVALVQRLFPLAGHVILAALRKARGCKDR